MPSPRPAPGSPEDWLARAKGKLILARQPLPSGGFFEDLCFHAQQASELAIKAVYQKKGLRFAFIHDLGKLLDGLKQQGMTIPPEVEIADQLSAYATLSRYPGNYPPVSQERWNQAVLIAEEVVRWAESIIS